MATVHRWRAQPPHGHAVPEVQGVTVHRAAPPGGCLKRRNDEDEEHARGSAAVSIKISKSKFVAGCQCLKWLYLQVHEPELTAEPDAAAEAIIERADQWRLRCD